MAQNKTDTNKTGTQNLNIYRWMYRIIPINKWYDLKWVGMSIATKQVMHLIGNCQSKLRNGARQAVRTAFMAGWNQEGVIAYQGCQICAHLRKTLYISIHTLSAIHCETQRIGKIHLKQRNIKKAMIQIVIQQNNL